MTETTETTETAQRPDTVAPARTRRPLRWWREAIYILAVYAVYSTVRNRFGSAGGPTGHSNAIAYGHALDVINIERFVGLYQEQHLQQWYLSLPRHGLIEFWNIFYGTAHFVVTAFALVWLYRADKSRYPLWRNTLAATTLLALLGFASFSLMPPRLLDETQARYGPPTSAAPRHDGFVDTLAEYPTVWSFDSGTLKSISNQYAAMPSLHCAWSTWAALVLVPLVRRRWMKALIVLHPFATLFCILVTANHYWLDALGGLAILGAGYWIARTLTEAYERRRSPRQADRAAVVPAAG